MKYMHITYIFELEIFFQNFLTTLSFGPLKPLNSNNQRWQTFLWCSEMFKLSVETVCHPWTRNVRYSLTIARGPRNLGGSTNTRPRFYTRFVRFWYYVCNSTSTLVLLIETNTSHAFFKCPTSSIPTINAILSHYMTAGEVDTVRVWFCVWYGLV